MTVCLKIKSSFMNYSVPDYLKVPRILCKSPDVCLFRNKSAKWYFQIYCGIATARVIKKLSYIV